MATDRRDKWLVASDRRPKLPHLTSARLAGKVTFCEPIGNVQDGPKIPKWLLIDMVMGEVGLTLTHPPKCLIPTRLQYMETWISVTLWKSLGIFRKYLNGYTNRHGKWWSGCDSGSKMSDTAMLDKLEENLLLLNKKFPKYVNGYWQTF